MQQERDVLAVLLKEIRRREPHALVGKQHVVQQHAGTVQGSAVAWLG